MHTIENFAQANKHLLRYIKPHSGPYTLDTMKALMNYLSNPQDTLRVIHIAGTSGKTSTSYYTASLLHHAGYSVGLSVSPHIDNVSERAQINMAPLDERLYCKELSTFLNLVDDSNLSPSYFEVLVAFAFWLFAKYKVDYAVVEVGLGGLLDGTNVINNPSKVCVITDIGYDHTEILGSTLQEITAQKAGIIQGGNKVFIHTQQNKVVKVVQQTCHHQSANLTVVSQQHIQIIQPHMVELPLFQQRNLALASFTVQNILNLDTALLQNIVSQSAATYIPGRVEEVISHNKRFFLDGSHNPQKISALVQTIVGKNPNSSVLLVSFGENKRHTIKESMRILGSLSSHIILTEFELGQDQPRKAISVDELSDIATSIGFKDISKEPHPAQALRLAIACKETTVIVTGSFYLLNHIRPSVLT